MKQTLFYYENITKKIMSSEKSTSFLSDFGINSAEILSSAIGKASDSSWKHNHSIPENVISNAIVLSSSLYGAIYLFSTSLIGLNKKWVRTGMGVTPFDYINCGIMGVSGIVILMSSQRAFAILNSKI